VPIRGEVKISFGHRPSGPPRVRLEPAGGTLGPTAWDGRTLVVSYEGLRNATRYQLILDANYESRFKDRGHSETRWSFTTERYPVLVSVAPSKGAQVIARNGQLAIEFNHRPAVDPRVSLVPADGTIDSGSWNGATWTVAYTGLKPLTGYQARVAVDYGVTSANIQQSWTFTTEPGIPPAGTPVLWHSGTDPANHAGVQRTIALDWDGNIVGTTYQPVTLQSADGSIVGTSDGTYFDRNGKPLGVLSGIPYYPVIADDSASVCELSSTVGGRTMDQLWLQTGPVTGPLRAVTPVGNFAGSAGIGIIACSTVNDRAVIGYGGMGGTSAVKVIALSTGRVVYQHTYVLAVSNIVSSHDERYLAEQMPVAGSMGAPSMTMIRRTSDGAIVARLDNQLAVRFSWDDRRLVTTTPYQGGTTNQVTLIEWPTNRVLWKLPAPPNQGQPFFAWAQPNGTKMAIAGSSQAAWPLDMLWVVDADGQAKQVLSESFYPASVIGF